jgi:hypothetical protein
MRIEMNKTELKNKRAPMSVKNQTHEISISSCQQLIIILNNFVFLRDG